MPAANPIQGTDRQTSGRKILMRSSPALKPTFAPMLAVMERPLADDEVLRRHAGVLAVLAGTHGLSDLALGDNPGELVATVAAGRTYFDVARFEMAVIDTLGFTVFLTPSTAPGAHIRERLASGAAA